MADALARTSLYLAMLVRASNAFPPALTGRDAAYHDSLLRAVAGVERVSGFFGCFCCECAVAGMEGVCLLGLLVDVC